MIYMISHAPKSSEMVIFRVFRTRRPVFRHITKFIKAIFRAFYILIHSSRIRTIRTPDFEFSMRDFQFFFDPRIGLPRRYPTPVLTNPRIGLPRRYPTPVLTNPTRATTATAATAAAETSTSTQPPVLTPRDGISRSVKTSLRYFGKIRENTLL